MKLCCVTDAEVRNGGVGGGGGGLFMSTHAMLGHRSLTSHPCNPETERSAGLARAQGVLSEDRLCQLQNKIVVTHVMLRQNLDLPLEYRASEGTNNVARSAGVTIPPPIVPRHIYIIFHVVFRRSKRECVREKIPTIKSRNWGGGQEYAHPMRDKQNIELNRGKTG